MLARDDRGDGDWWFPDMGHVDIFSKEVDAGEGQLLIKRWIDRARVMSIETEGDILLFCLIFDGFLCFEQEF